MPEEQRLASMHIVDTRARVHSAGAAMSAKVPDVESTTVRPQFVHLPGP
ncbi:MAG: hypothetical protein H0X05_03155 [Actinobacteria bacterium]|nr:hypothetical protein [Actinomycetota bacterium]